MEEAVVRLACQDAGDCFHLVLAVLLEERDAGADDDAEAGCFLSYCNSSISCFSSSSLFWTLSLSGTKTGSMELFGKNSGTYWIKRTIDA